MKVKPPHWWPRCICDAPCNPSFEHGVWTCSNGDCRGFDQTCGYISPIQRDRLENA